jgi:AAA15 family ATPase/GTPase
LRNFSIDGFRQVNLIGGLNGTGKSSVLEALFLAMDIRNPIAIFRTHQWRNLPISADYAHESLFGKSRALPLKIETIERSGKKKSISIEWGDQILPANTQFSINDDQARNETISRQGFKILVKEDGRVVVDRSIAGDAGGIIGNENVDVNVDGPMATMFSRYTMNMQSEISERYSYLISRGLKKKIVDILNIVSPDCIDLEILQISGISILHAEVSGGSYVPLSFAGDGVLTAVSIGMAIMQAKNGMILLDEFDAAVHYSKLPVLWELIGNLSKEYMCQIFSATHSRESIDAAMIGMAAANRKDDVSYFRLDRLAEKTIATQYVFEDLKVAGNEYWEIR